MLRTRRILLMFVIFFAVLLPVKVANASGEGVVYGAIEIQHICDDCVKYDLGVKRDGDYLGGRDHTFTVVIKDEYNDILNPEDVVWEVKKRTLEPGCGTTHGFRVISGERDEYILSKHQAQTITIPTEVGCRYEISAYITLNNKLYRADKYAYTMDAVYRDPDTPNVERRILRPGQTWNLSDDHAKLFTLDNMATGGEDVRIGDHARSLYAGASLRSAAEISDLTFTAIEGVGASSSFGFDFGDYAYDRTTHHLTVVPDRLELGLLTPSADSSYWYEPEAAETLYVRYELNLKEVTSIPKIKVYDSENNAYSYDSKNVTSSENIRRSCGAFDLKAGNTYFFELSKLEEGVSFTFSKEKPADYDEIQEAGNNSTSHSLVQNILGVEDTYSFVLGDTPVKLGAYTDSGATIIYDSLTPEVVSVDETGTLTINKAGTAKIDLTVRAYTDPETGWRYIYTSKMIWITVTDPSEKPESKISLSGASVTGLANKTYTGKEIRPAIAVKANGVTLVKGTDYKVTYSNNKNAGTAKVVITGTGKYTGTITKSFKIAKAANPLTAKAKGTTVSYKKLKKKNQSIAAKKVFTVSKNQGKVTYKWAGGNKKITISPAGKITVKKGLKKGNYKLTVKVTAAGNSNYKAGSRTLKIKIKVK